jgi:hypothetical protein
MDRQPNGELDYEQDRQQLVRELCADQGPQWTEQYKPGSFGCHELLDRISLIVDNVDKYILSHPACVQNPDWFALAEQVVAVLHDLYRQVGAEHLDEKNDKGDDS